TPFPFTSTMGQTICPTLRTGKQPHGVHPLYAAGISVSKTWTICHWRVLMSPSLSVRFPMTRSVSTVSDKYSVNVAVDCGAFNLGRRAGNIQHRFSERVAIAVAECRLSVPQ